MEAACYIVIFQPVSQSRDLSKFFDLVKNYGTWARITETSWAVVTETSASNIRDQFKELLIAGDQLFVIKSGRAAAWSNVRCTNEWLKKNI